MQVAALTPIINEALDAYNLVKSAPYVSNIHAQPEDERSPTLLLYTRHDSFSCTLLHVEDPLKVLRNVVAAFRRFSQRS
jgi:hypothetical protein